MAVMCEQVMVVPAAAWCSKAGRFKVIGSAVLATSLQAGGYVPAADAPAHVMPFS
jgi:hypothetical protein